MNVYVLKYAQCYYFHYDIDFFLNVPALTPHLAQPQLSGVTWHFLTTSAWLCQVVSLCCSSVAMVTYCVCVSVWVSYANLHWRTRTLKLNYGRYNTCDFESLFMGKYRKGWDLRWHHMMLKLDDQGQKWIQFIWHSQSYCGITTSVLLTQTAICSTHQGGHKEPGGQLTVCLNKVNTHARHTPTHTHIKAVYGIADEAQKTPPDSYFSSHTYLLFIWFTSISFSLDAKPDYK